jgi:hypothetical protein
LGTAYEIEMPAFQNTQICGFDRGARDGQKQYSGTGHDFWADGMTWDWNSIRDWGFNGLAIIFFAIVIYRFIPAKESKNVSVSAVILAMFCAVLGNPDRIASLKFLGFETQTRELTKTIDDAKEAIRQIRELAVVTAEGLIELRENSNAFLGVLAGGQERDEYRAQDEFKTNVVDVLKNIPLQVRQVHEMF